MAHRYLMHICKNNKIDDNELEIYAIDVRWNDVVRGDVHNDDNVNLDPFAPTTIVNSKVQYYVDSLKLTHVNMRMQWRNCH